MKIDISAGLIKLEKIHQALPMVSLIIKDLAKLAPQASGPAKADAVVAVVLNAVPELRDCEPELRTSIDGLVRIFKSDGSIPSKTEAPDADAGDVEADEDAEDASLLARGAIYLSSETLDGRLIPGDGGPAQEP